MILESDVTNRSRYPRVLRFLILVGVLFVAAMRLAPMTECRIFNDDYQGIRATCLNMDPDAHWSGANILELMSIFWSRPSETFQIFRPLNLATIGANYLTTGSRPRTDSLDEPRSPSPGDGRGHGGRLSPDPAVIALGVGWGGAGVRGQSVATRDRRLGGVAQRTACRHVLRRGPRDPARRTASPWSDGGIVRSRARLQGKRVGLCSAAGALRLVGARAPPHGTDDVG